MPIEVGVPDFWTHASLGLTATALTRTSTQSSRTFGIEVSCTSAVWLGSILIAFMFAFVLPNLTLTLIRLHQNGPRCTTLYFYIGEQSLIVSNVISKQPRTTLRARTRKRFGKVVHKQNQMDRGLATPTLAPSTHTPAPTSQRARNSDSRSANAVTVNV